eukprot:gnl/MRDRNA2_/MRDRNA2_31440_c0_seq1.p1 gnl/MRDRNA2_/MRDRNA2_31440_c0~~gnl/MRDRNA2_/MRDRNA2_31440_c0_seq1.p1  ORF type:complete len:244 (+),score=86.60 gnl/MRDRNA2_/MRDRNA2_31440_c0_seq1:120-851(+)
MSSRNMKTSRTSSKNTGAISRKFSLDSDPSPLGLKELLKGKKRSATAQPKAVAESKAAKRRREVEKDESPMPAKMDDSPTNAKMQDSPDSPDAELGLGSLHGPRIGDRHSVETDRQGGRTKDNLCKQIEELGDFVKELCGDRRRAAKGQCSMPFSEKNKEEALQACEDTLMKERTKLQQIFGKLQESFQESQSMVDQYKAKIRDIRAQEEKDLAWVKQLEKNAEEQLNELLVQALKSNGKKRY